ncbi:MAG: hypothetical protein RLZZ546_2373 [Bacteroidota bacterium]|jgi:predicted small secreted protein
MSKKLPYLLAFSLILISFLSLSSCKTGEGCGLEEKYGAKIGDDGSMSSKRGSSNLFSKKQRKRMKKS